MEDESCMRAATTAHFVLIPLMAPGHMIPLLDVAKLLTSHGAVVTFVTTPANAARIQSTIDLYSSSALRFAILPFPSVEVGLPQGCESLDALPSRDLVRNFIRGTTLLRLPLQRHLKDQQPPPSSVIADFGHTWADRLARELRVPRLVFHGFGAFALLCWHNLHHHRTYEHAASDSDPIVIPGLPFHFEVTRTKLPSSFNVSSKTRDIAEEIRATELAADGVVINTFSELEPEYVAAYKAVTGKKVWTVGPVSLLHSNRDSLASSVAARGDEVANDALSRCSMWLDAQAEAGSVVYASFGSMARLAPTQLAEVGLGLEASAHPFIWVVRAGEKEAEVEEWLADDGFEERNKGRGLVIRRWAPQVAILNHKAVGGFLTHCGWNSILEGLAAGLPLATWPMFADQFLNEKAVVDVLGVGIGIGVKKAMVWGEEGMGGAAVIGREEIAEAVRRVMGGGEEAERRRSKAREAGEMARRAMEEGGSSRSNLAMLVRDHATLHHCCPRK